MDIKDECPNLMGKVSDFFKRMLEKVIKINPELSFLFYQEVLCKAVLKINHVVGVAAKVVNFIRA